MPTKCFAINADNPFRALAVIDAISIGFFTNTIFRVSISVTLFHLAKKNLQDCGS